MRRRMLHPVKRTTDILCLDSPAAQVRRGIRNLPRTVLLVDRPVRVEIGHPACIDAVTAPKQEPKDPGAEQGRPGGPVAEACADTR